MSELPRRVAPAQIAVGGAALFVVLLLTLHVIKPELDPSWRFISEYAIGRHGWVMVAAFLSLAAGYLALLAALRPLLGGGSGWVARAALVVSATGLVIGAAFVTDPITTPPDAATVTGTVHSIGGTLGLAMPVAIAMVGWKLVRHRRRSDRPSIGLAVVTAAALVAFVGSVAIVGSLAAQHGGTFGPDVPVGWPTRVEILAYSLWLLVVGFAAARDAVLDAPAGVRDRQPA